MSIHKVKRYDIPIYFGYLYVVLSDNFQESAEKLHLPVGETPLKCFGACTWGKHNKKNVTEYFLFFPPDPSHMSIAHESLHVVNWIFNDRNIKLDVVYDEPQAYLLGWVVTKVYESI